MWLQKRRCPNFDLVNEYIVSFTIIIEIRIGEIAIIVKWRERKIKIIGNERCKGGRQSLR